MVISLYAGLLTIWLVILSVRVIGLRGNPLFSVMAFAPHGKKALERAIRAHGNFCEYTPLFLILLYMLEQQGAAATTIHAYGASFLVGRLMHGVCFGFMTQSLPLRIAGTALTLFALLGLAVQLLML